MRLVRELWSAISLLLTGIILNQSINRDKLRFDEYLDCVSGTLWDRILFSFSSENSRIS